MMEYIGIIMFFVALAMLLFGYPVAFTFGGVALVFSIIAKYPDISEMLEDGATFSEVVGEATSTFAFMPFRIQSIMENTVLMAVPLFIFMGIVLQKTRLAEQLLESMGKLFGSVRGGLAISTILVGALLAASTGVVGASVVAMGLISLPVMLKYNYDKPLACGTICASGTLGQIIPPSIILIILGDVLGIPVGDLFKAAIGPGLVLIGVYVIYVLTRTWLKPDDAPALPMDEDVHNKREQVVKALIAILPPLVLILVVLGSIFAGIASPTEAAAVGAVGATLLTVANGKFNVQILNEVMTTTVKLTCMVFIILCGAAAFGLVFRGMGGDLVGDAALLDVVALRQAEVLLRRHVAEHGRAVPADLRRPDGAGDVVVRRSDVRGEGPEGVEGRLETVGQLLVHVLADQLHGNMTRTFDHHLNIFLPGTECQLAEYFELAKLRIVGRIGQTTRTQ